jgi:hypothetical protein
MRKRWAQVVFTNAFDNMKFLVTIFYSFFSISLVFSQYSVSGSIVIPYSLDSLIPLNKLDIYLIDKDKVTLTDINGHFSFDNLEKGNYSIEIGGSESIFNKLIISDILVTKRINLDTIQIIQDFSNPSWTSLASAISISGLRYIYKDNGQLILDTITNNFYDHGLYREGRSIVDPKDSVWRLYRQGEWKNDRYILYYDHGRLNGDFSILDSSRQNIICRGYYKNYKRDGIWIYYDAEGKEDFRINFIDDYLIINQTDFNLNDYRSNIWRIYNF